MTYSHDACSYIIMCLSCLGVISMHRYIYSYCKKTLCSELSGLYINALSLYHGSGGG